MTALCPSQQSHAVLGHLDETVMTCMTHAVNIRVDSHTCRPTKKLYNYVYTLPRTYPPEKTQSANRYWLPVGWKYDNIRRSIHSPRYNMSSRTHIGLARCTLKLCGSSVSSRSTGRPQCTRSPCNTLGT